MKKTDVMQKVIAEIVVVEPEQIGPMYVASAYGILVALLALAFFDMLLGIPFVPEITALVIIVLLVIIGIVWVIRHYN